MIACHRKIIQIILASNIARVQIPWGYRFFLFRFPTSIVSPTNTWTADAKISSSSSSRSSNLVSLVSNSGGDSIISAILAVLSSWLLSVSLVRQGSAPPDDVYIDDVNYCYRSDIGSRHEISVWRIVRKNSIFHVPRVKRNRSVRFNGVFPHPPRGISFVSTFLSCIFFPSSMLEFVFYISFHVGKECTT